jgi:putative oxidoreductase
VIVNPQILQSTGLLALRAIIGVVFLAHGLDKLDDMAGTERFFDSLGIPAPALMAPVATITEVVAGVLLIIGLLTPLAGVALAIDMAVALVAAHADGGFFVTDGGYEYVLVLGVATLSLAATGPGRFSLDAALKLPDRVPGRLWLTE